MNIPSTRSGEASIPGHHKLRSSMLIGLLATVFLVTSTSSLAANTSQKECGSAGSFAVPEVFPTLNLGTIKPFKVFKNASYGTGGVALRNRGAGGISISGVVAPVQAAYIYWAVIDPNADSSKITVKRLYPGTAGPVTLPGVVVGAGKPPCPWPGNQIVVFRAQMKAGFALGNGLYEVSPFGVGAGTTDGSDPWAVVALPLWEGASIVMVGQPSGAPGLVSIYDRGLAGNTFISGGGLAYNLALPITTPGIRTLFDNIGADGQHVQAASRLANPAFTQETTTIGPPQSGPGSLYWDSDWNGSSGLPVPELWDDTGHDITALGSGVGALPVTVSQPKGLDCLTPVANVVEED
jgi:hypothetical protein